MAEEVESMDEQEDEVDDEAHEKLLKSLFGSKKNSSKLRGVASSSLDLAVHAGEDVTKIGHDDLKLKRKSAAAQLKKPLSVLETEKAKRHISRETMVAEMTKWDPIVKEIRSAPQIVYTSRPHGLKMHAALQPKQFTPRTSLEQEIYAALGKSSDVLKTNQELTETEARALKAMSVKEAKARREELLKHHELLTRMEKKAKRVKKIKSKRYRKLLKNERINNEKKQLEQLQKTNPEAFLEKLELLERNRMEERLTLKHKGGGRFSRLHKAYSKFDDKTREAVNDMLQKGKELTKKYQDADSSEEEASEIPASIEPAQPALGSTPTPVTLVNLRSLNKQAIEWLEGPKKDSEKPPDGVPASAASQLTNLVLASGTDTNGLTPPVAHNSPIRSTEGHTTTHGNEGCQDEPEAKKVAQLPAVEKQKRKRKKKTAPQVEEKSCKPVTETTLAVSPANRVEGEDFSATMEELFNDEDVVEEFSKEKAEMEGRKKLKLDTKLPGWGNWAGPDYKTSKNPRPAVSKGHKTKDFKPQQTKVKQPFVWINPSHDEAIRKLQPKNVPFPYTSVQQYESSLRQPVSRGLVPETATKLLVKPEVITKQGHIIKPLDKEDFLKKDKNIYDEIPIKIVKKKN
ncbi:U3 small nucleolar RNA-associated protein 14 homolog C-like [Physella acuta]|uniref:U3 small nucleolar RNA-associated protein 14 homolog C-like n=1 Tax=Physella acuta TaxID=109671 RepID=UPI0027DBAD65|nr:U3 small nucleolar RNA-associated protein 14 homolog C-like [Physella acuta]